MSTTDRKTILILDDEVDLHEMIAEELGFHGFKTVTASNGKEGLDLLNTLKPDLVITDFNMPIMNGLEFLEVLRQQGSVIPVIFVTAHGTKDIFRKTLIQDHFEFIEKPVDLLTLVDAVKRALLKVSSGDTSNDSQTSKDFIQKAAFGELKLSLDKRILDAFNQYCEQKNRSHRGLVEDLLSTFLVSEGALALRSTDE